MTNDMDFASVQHSGPIRPGTLIPEVAFLIRQHLETHDLAVASRVCKNWNSVWTPFLYHSVRYNHYHSNYSHHYTNSLLNGQQNHHRRTESWTLAQQPAIPFLNVGKYGPWIKVLELTNLVVAHHLPAGGVTPPTSGLPALAATAESSFRCPPFVQDHLHQLISCCSSMQLLTQLDITKTVMSLERLDELLSVLSKLKVFKFEVVNKIESCSASSSPIGSPSHSRTSSYGSNGFIRGHMPSQTSLLRKPKRTTLEGMEQEVVRTIARRLTCLEQLDLTFTVTGTVVLSAFVELFASCGSTLKKLSITRAKICQRDFSHIRGWDDASSYQAEIAALLASLALDIPPPPPASSSSQLWNHGSTPSSPTTSLSTSASSDSISSFTTSSTSSSEHSSPKDVVLESLSMYSCSIDDHECAWFLKQAPGLRELNLHECKRLSGYIVNSILTHTPSLDTLSLSSLSIPQEGLCQLFRREDISSETESAGTSSTPSTTGAALSTQTGLQLKNVRLAYLRQLDDEVMATLATYQGCTLVKLSVQWCAHVTDDGILPIFKSCEKLQDLSLCLSKPTLDIFKELTETTTPGGGSEVCTTTKRLWACAQTLERLEISGQMFVDRIRTSSEHLQPQLYHHTSPNPHHIRNGSTSGVTTTSSFGFGISGSSNSSGSTNVIHNTYAIAHHQGYPMYHLGRYDRYSDPFKELQAQLETLPRLTHLGVPAKGIEHLIQKGFGPKVQLKSLTLLNQQGRPWTVEEVDDLLKHMPSLRQLTCEKSTILLAPAVYNRMDPVQHKRQEEVKRLLERSHVELVQS
ncbi:hypothetical protein BGX31_009249 [Mortierella sp. GBA43]|nr:hypothetical protein BGX31_009249 [Mortierella sp. GBA43]